MEFFYSIYKRGNEVLLAACDEDVIDKEFFCEDPEIKLDVKKAFYGKNKCGKDEVVSLMEGATILNLVGEALISIAIEEGLIENSCVLVIGKTKHAQRAKFL